MIHQHFKLVDVFSATENIMLGVDDGKKFSEKDARAKVVEISEKYGFELDRSRQKVSIRCRFLRSRRWKSSRCFTGSWTF